MPLAIGALGQSQDEQVSLLQTRAKMMEEEDRVWSNVTRDEATSKMVEDELMVANISGLDAERFLSNITQEGATAVSGCNWVQSGASGSAQEPHCHYSNYKPVCSPANSGRYYFGNPWDVMGGNAKTLATCNGGWYYHGSKPTDRKFTCDCPKPPPPLPAGAVCDWTESSTSGSFPEPHCHYANFHPSCDANSRGKYYYGNPWDVGGGNAQELSSCNGGWFNHGAKPYHRKFSCDCSVPPTPSPTPAPTAPPAPSANCDWVQSGASGSSPQPHCHYANYKPVCNEDRSGKYYFGNPWDVMGGDAKSLADCNGGWYYHGSKPQDRKFTCACTGPPAPAPAPSASCDWVQSGASGSSPQPHCHYANYNPVCNAANSDKYYYGNPWDVMGGDAQSLADCNGGWYYHGSKPQDRKFTCQCTGGPVGDPEPAPAPAPKPKKCNANCRKGPYIKKKSCKKKKCAGCCECTGECEAQTKPKKDKTKCEKKCYKKNGNKAMKTSMCKKNKCAACAECSSFLEEIDDVEDDDDDEYYDEDEDDVDDDDEDDI